MISFDVLPLPENESSEAAVTCDLLPLPEEKFTVHRIEWAGCNYCTWKCLKMGCTRMYPKMRKMDLGVSQVWVADIIAKKSLRYSFSQHIVGLVVVLEIWLLNRNSTPLFNASLVLPKHWSNPHNYNPDVSEKWGEDSCRFFVKDTKIGSEFGGLQVLHASPAKHKELPTEARFSMVCFWT